MLALWVPFFNKESDKFSDLPVHASKGGCRMCTTEKGGKNKIAFRLLFWFLYSKMDSYHNKVLRLTDFCGPGPTLWFWRPPIQKMDRRDAEKWVHFVKGVEKHLRMIMLFGIPEIFGSLWRKLLWIAATLWPKEYYCLCPFFFKKKGMLGVPKYNVAFYFINPQTRKSIEKNT